MTDQEEHSNQQAKPSNTALAVNVLTSPAEAFPHLKANPSFLFPLGLILILNASVLIWYFNIVDFAWYIDDALSLSTLEGEQLEEARGSMASMSSNTFMAFGILGSAVGISLIYILQAGYLSMVSALRGEVLKFKHWFSLVSWTGLPFILSIVGMVVTIALSPNGQLSSYDLDPLTLRNLGMESDNTSVQNVFASVNLTMIWSMVLMIFAHHQLLESSWLRAILTITAPYLVILSIWSFFAFS